MWFSNVSRSQSRLLLTFWRKATAKNVMLLARFYASCWFCDFFIIFVTIFSGSYNEWCFLCEFQAHLERVRRSPQAFSPMHILSGLHNIKGDFDHGSQEDAHEFMRFIHYCSYS